jgi:hypothetical protein
MEKEEQSLVIAAELETKVIVLVHDYRIQFWWRNVDACLVYEPYCVVCLREQYIRRRLLRGVKFVIDYSNPSHGLLFAAGSKIEYVLLGEEEDSGHLAVIRERNKKRTRLSTSLIPLPLITLAGLALVCNFSTANSSTGQSGSCPCDGSLHKSIMSLARSTSTGRSMISGTRVST